MNIKRFNENKNIDNLKIGDYVICENSTDNKLLTEFIQNRIGRYINYDEYESRHFPYIIQYENIPKQLKDNIIYDSSIMFRRDEIIHYSENKKDLEFITQSAKYNI